MVGDVVRVDADAVVDDEAAQPASGDLQSYLLILRDGPPRLWVDTIAWFLSLLPHDAEVAAILETNPEHIAALPGKATSEQISVTLEALERAE